MQLDMETKITTAEVTNILNSIPKDTTPGPDKVAYSDLKCISGDEELLNDLSSLDLTQHINTTLKEGSIPVDWRDVISVFCKNQTKTAGSLKAIV